jgi:hypothetical protein
VVDIQIADKTHGESETSNNCNLAIWIEAAVFEAI